MSKGTHFINHNGRLQEGNKPAIPAENRAFRYGDSLFESICLRNGRMPLLQRHWERLERGCGILKMKMPAKWNEKFFHSQIQQLILDAGMEEGARIRLTVYRADGGFYSPKKMDAEFLIEASPLPGNAFSPEAAGLNVSIFTEHVKTPGKLAALKTGNGLLYVLAAIGAKEHEVDDMLLLNETGGIVEATGSNVFYFHEEKLFTPPLVDGCVDGVMRKHIMENTDAAERQTTLQHLAEADEIFLCNATLGIRSVGMFKNKEYGDSRMRELAEKIYGKMWG